AGLLGERGRVVPGPGLEVGGEHVAGQGRGAGGARPDGDEAECGENGGDTCDAQGGEDRTQGRTWSHDGSSNRAGDEGAGRSGRWGRRERAEALVGGGGDLVERPSIRVADPRWAPSSDRASLLSRFLTVSVPGAHGPAGAQAPCSG